MKAGTYQQEVNRTLLDTPPSPLSDEETMIIWCALGLSGEAGELVDLIKKGIFHRHGIDKGELKEELGDLLWYLTALCSKFEIDLESVMERNIQKLEVRYPKGFTTLASKLRIDKGEQDD